jgi:hypothetical protein
MGAAIRGKANFGAALMLLCYTEVLGGVATGTLGKKGTSEREELQRGRWEPCFQFARLQSKCSKP